MISFTGIFQGFYLDFNKTVSSSLCSPTYWLKPPLIKFWDGEGVESSMFSTLVGNPVLEHNTCNCPVTTVADGGIFLGILKTITWEKYVRRWYYFCYGWKTFCVILHWKIFW